MCTAIVNSMAPAAKSLASPRSPNPRGEARGFESVSPVGAVPKVKVTVKMAARGVKAEYRRAKRWMAFALEGDTPPVPPAPPARAAAAEETAAGEDDEPKDEAYKRKQVTPKLRGALGRSSAIDDGGGDCVETVSAPRDSKPKLNPSTSA